MSKDFRERKESESDENYKSCRPMLGHGSGAVSARRIRADAMN